MLFAVCPPLFRLYFWEVKKIQVSTKKYGPQKHYPTSDDRIVPARSQRCQFFIMVKTLIVVRRQT